MNIKHTDSFREQLEDFNNAMDNNHEKTNKTQQREEETPSDEVVISFVRSMSSSQAKEIISRIKVRDNVIGYIGNREIYNYCKEFNIVPDKYRAEEPKENPMKYYHLLTEFQDFKVDGRDCFVKKNDVENKVLTVIFDDNNEVRNIKY